MKNNDDVIKGWILKAESDIETLKILMERNKSLDTACFHAQQAGEKYLKAFLNFNGIEFPKTHDIEELLEFCAKLDKRFNNLTKDTSFLTAYAVELRYDFNFWPDINRVENALKAVNKIKQLVLSLLPDELHP
jgi:HEPN domain-containing protein